MGASISRRAWNKQFVKPKAPTCRPHGVSGRSWRLPVAAAIVMGGALWAAYGEIGSMVDGLTSSGQAALQELLPAQPGRNPEMRWPLPAPANPWGQYVVQRGTERIGRVDVRRAHGVDSHRAAYLASYVGGPVTAGDVLVDPRR